MPVRSKWQSLPTEAINPATLAIDKQSAADIVEGMLSVPAFAGFKGADHLYNVAFHELTHWSGHRSRLDRDLKKRFHRPILPTTRKPRLGVSVVTQRCRASFEGILRG